MIWSRDFWKATTERVIRAFTFSFLSALGVSTGLDLRAVDWKADLAVAGGTALLSLLVCIAAGAGLGPVGSPSLVRDPAAANQPAPRVPTAADRLDLEEQLLPPGHVRKVGGGPITRVAPPTTRGTWTGSGPPD